MGFVTQWMKSRDGYIIHRWKTKETRFARKRVKIQVTRNENGEQEGQGGHMVRHCGALFFVHVLLTVQGKNEHGRIPFYEFHFHFPGVTTVRPPQRASPPTPIQLSTLRQAMEHRAQWSATVPSVSSHFASLLVVDETRLEESQWVLYIAARANMPASHHRATTHDPQVPTEMSLRGRVASNGR